jgi:hypothetical protein
MRTNHPAFIQRSLDRQPNWAPLVDGAMEDDVLPAWLVAVPLVMDNPDLLE